MFSLHLLLAQVVVELLDVGLCWENSRIHGVLTALRAAWVWWTLDFLNKSFPVFSLGPLAVHTHSFALQLICISV